MPDNYLQQVKEDEARLDAKKTDSAAGKNSVSEKLKNFENSQQTQEISQMLDSATFQKKQTIAERIKDRFKKIAKLPVLKQILMVFFFFKKWYYKLKIDNIVNIPLISLILGMITACITPLRYYLVVAPPPGTLSFVFLLTFNQLII